MTWIPREIIRHLGRVAAEAEVEPERPDGESGVESSLEDRARPGERIGPFRIVRRIGRGGMGEVYEALDTRLGRHVALKLLLATDPLARERLLREARAAAAIEHASAVVVHEVGEAEGTAYIAMELVAGVTLRAFAASRTLSVADKLRLSVDVARALGAAHRAGVVHRDVKPDNVMVRADGVVKVLDFGIAARAWVETASPGSDEPASARAQSGVGTPRYAAPEQLRGERVDRRADLFSWGVLTYELLAGASPWEGDEPRALLATMLSQAPRPLRTREGGAKIPRDVEKVLLRALAVGPEERGASIDAAADALEPFTRRSAPAARRAVLLAAGAAVLFAVAAAVSAPLLRRGALGPPSPPPQRTLSALRCASATTTGDADPELARAIGVGACARLATALGARWGNVRTAPELLVSAVLHEREATVRLEVAGISAEGTAPTPLGATWRAIDAFGARITGPPMSAEEVASWGAPDAEAARRIARAVRSLDLRLMAPTTASLRDLRRVAPGSAWWGLLLDPTKLQAQERASLREEAIQLADRLPPAQRDAVRGALLLARSRAARDEALTSLRRAYASSTGDADIASMAAVALLEEGAREEGLAIAERLTAQSPPFSLAAMRTALRELPVDDPARDDDLVDRIAAVLPEARAWREPLRHLVRRGRIDDAKRAIALARRMGASWGLSAAEAELLLATFDPTRARALARELLADPLPTRSVAGAEMTIAAYLLEGRIAEAQALETEETERLRALGNSLLAAAHAHHDLKVRRILGEPAPRSDRTAWLEATLVDSKEVDTAFAEAVRCEVALARMAASPETARAIGARALHDLDEGAAHAVDAFERDDVLLAGIGLLRAVRGEAEAAARWRGAPWASSIVRRHAALDGAIALEAVGDRAGAAAAYEIAADPLDIAWAGLPTLASRARLARLYRSMGKTTEADRLDALVAGLLVKADRGVREALLGEAMPKR